MATFSSNQPGLCDIHDNRKVDPMAPCTPTIAGPSDIQLTAIITAPGQFVTVNKYFANAYTVSRGDGTARADLTSDTTHTYASTGTYVITLSLTGGATRWKFQNGNDPLVPSEYIQPGSTTASDVYVSHMPDLAAYFGDSATNVGNNFFRSFNSYGALTSLPSGSFDTSNITTVGDDFFSNFNAYGSLTVLPS